LILNTGRPHTHTHPYLPCPHIYQGETDTYGTVVSSRLAAPHQSYNQPHPNHPALYKVELPP
jgi:hypothetical protein